MRGTRAGLLEATLGLRSQLVPAHLIPTTPMGVPSTTPGGTPKHYRDNRVQYMLTHPTQYTGNGVFAIVFSPGGATSADITTDGGQFANLFHAYLANPAPYPGAPSSDAP